MSNARAKAERSKAKDARQQSAPDKALKKKGRKKAKPVVLMAQYQKQKDDEIFPEWFWSDKPFVFGRYRNIAEAEKVIKLQRLKRRNPYLFSLDGIHYS